MELRKRYEERKSHEWTKLISVLHYDMLKVCIIYRLAG